MSKSIVGIAKTRTDVEAVVTDLQNSGIPVANISILLPDSGGFPETGAVKATKAPEGTTTGVVAGGLAGGALGLLAGIGALAIPGVGPLIAAGPIMASLSGAAVGATAGGIVGALVGLGIPEIEAKVYEERIKKGGYLVAVHVASRDQDQVARDVFKRNHLEDVSAVTEK